ncbi:MAG: hypothetical protein U0T82_05745 [Bacteroidales bacterium]
MTIAVDDVMATFTSGSTTKIYQLTTCNPAECSTYSPRASICSTDIIDQLINPTNQVQSVTYHFKGRIRDDRRTHQ